MHLGFVEEFHDPAYAVVNNKKEETTLGFEPARLRSKHHF
jgi:hypothetical protein